MKFGVCPTYTCAPSSVVDLPIKSWKEVKEWYVKWDTLHYTLDGKLWEEVELDSNILDSIDTKNPESVKVYNPKTLVTIAED